MIGGLVSFLTSIDSMKCIHVLFKMDVRLEKIDCLDRLHHDLFLDMM